MKIYTFFILVFFLIPTVNAQITYDYPSYSINAGSDSNICGNNCVTINRKATTQHENRSATSYLVQRMTMPSPAYGTNGTSLNLPYDDEWSGLINIGFNFCFFGNTYNKLVIGTNACVSFNTSYANGYCDYYIDGDITSTYDLYNGILGGYTDIDISEGGSVRYRLEGTAPNRRFVVTFYQIPLFDCTNLKVTSQIILHEAYNIIDVVIINKPICTSWQDGQAILGIQNSSGNVYYTAPGWNPSMSSQSNVCYRFLPNGALRQSVNWTNTSGAVLSGSDMLTQSICPSSSNTYIANVVNTNCNGTTVTARDTVVFKINSPPVVTVNSSSICSGTTATLTASGANTYTWNNGLGAGNPKTTPPLTANTSYIVTGTNTTTGCQDTAMANVTIKPSPVVTVNSPSICSGTTAVLTASGANTYSWNNGLGTGNPKTTPPLTANTSYIVTGTNTTTGCQDTAIANVTITASPVVTVNSPTICNGSSAILTASGASTYMWSNGSTGSSITVNPTVTTNYTVTGTFPGCSSSTATSTVTVTGLPTVNDPSDQKVCMGTNTSAVNFSGSIGATFSWTNNNTAIGLAGSGTGNIPSFTALAGGTATITVTPRIGTCTGTPQTFTINVLNPNGTRLVPTGLVCNGTQLNFNAIPVGGNGIYTYNWLASNPTVSGNVDTFSYATINNTNTNITTTITLSVTSNGLTCQQQFFSIIKPTPTVTDPSDQTICVSMPTAAINFSGNISNTVYSWTNSNTSIGLASIGTGNIPSFTTLTFGVSTITVTPSNNGCTGVPQIFTITVNPNGTLVLTGGNNTQTNCINTAISNILYTVGGGATGASVTGLPSGVTGTYSQGVFTISGTPTVSGIFNYTVSTTGTCTQNNLTGTLTITPDGTLVLTTGNNTQTKCVNTAISNILYTVGGGATGASVTGLPSGVTGTYSQGIFTISGTPTVSGIFNYTVTTVGTCTQSTLTGTITVNSNGTLVLTGGNNTQTNCINTAISNILYTVGGGATGASVTGLPSGVTGTYSQGIFTISGTPTVSGIFNYTVSTTGTCTQNNLTGTLTITPDGTLVLTTGNNTQTKCVNTAISNILYTVGGGATGASVTGLPSGVTGTYSQGVFTISGTPTVSGIFNYTVTTVGTCTQSTLTGTITVNPNGTLVLTGGNNTQTNCINTAISNIVYTVGGGATGASVTGLPSGVTGTYSQGVFTISGTPTVSGIFNYTVSTTGTCTQNNLTGTLTITPDGTLVLTTGNNTQTNCINTAISNIVYTVGGGATGASVTGLPSGVTGTYSQGIFTISGTPTVSGIFNYTVTTVGTCTQSTLTGTITVNPIIAPSVNISSINNNICPNDTIKLIASSSVTSSYQWYVNAIPTGMNSNQFASSLLNDGDSIHVVITSATTCTVPNTAVSNIILAKVNKINYTKPTPVYCLNDSFLVDTLNLRISTTPDPNYMIFWTNGSNQIIDSVHHYLVHNTVSGQLPFTIKYGNNCAVDDELNLTVHPLPAIDAIVDFPRVEYGGEVELDVVSNALVNYHWLPAGSVSNDSIRNPNSIITSSTLFVVNVQDSNGCTNRDSVFVELINDCEENRIYLPTGFSPNRDGINDCFGILSPPMGLSDYRLLVYDRWGEKVFETSDKDICWDGTYKGAEVLADSYSYIVSFKCSNGISLSKRGVISIVR